jgi:uncharacterized protein (TIGR03437 family)
VAVQQATPGLFTVGGSGTGTASALNEDGSANDQRNPAERGSLIALFATGLGAMTAPLADGTVISGTDAQAQLPVTVAIGGLSAPVEYVGGAPGYVAGVFQLNVRIPVGIPNGDVPVVVSAGNFSSPSAGVTISVR